MLSTLLNSLSEFTRTCYKQARLRLSIKKLKEKSLEISFHLLSMKWFVITWYASQLTPVQVSILN